MELPKEVWMGTYTRKKLYDVWNKIKDYDNLFADDDLRNPDAFLDIFLASDSVILETEGGFMSIEHIRPGLKAEVHFCFWDHKLSARLELMKECLLWAFVQFDLQRIETQVADYARGVRRFVERKMNFVHEGTKRASLYHNGRLIDMHIYSILRSEVI